MRLFPNGALVSGRNVGSCVGKGHAMAELKQRPLTRPHRFDLHLAALRDGGFREVGVIWQNMGTHVLLAVR